MVQCESEKSKNILKKKPSLNNIDIEHLVKISIFHCFVNPEFFVSFSQFIRKL
jgi:hypothetical protein